MPASQRLQNEPESLQPPFSYNNNHSLVLSETACFTKMLCMASIYCSESSDAALPRPLSSLQVSPNSRIGEGAWSRVFKIDALQKHDAALSASSMKDETSPAVLKLVWRKKGESQWAFDARTGKSSRSTSAGIEVQA